LKQALSILLLVVAMLNLGGYGLFMACMEQRANEKMELALDENNYDSSTLISIKVPVKNLPYYTNSAQFQRQDGKIEVDGVTYNFVKQRIYRDTLEMLCIPNSSATRFCKARNDFYKLSNDLENASKKGKAAASPFKYFSPITCLEKKFHDEGVYHDPLSITSTHPLFFLPSYYATPIDNPPEVC